MPYVVCNSDNKELKGKQAKQSVEAVKSVTADKTIKNRAERDRCVKWVCTDVYIGWSDAAYLWSQCDRHFVGQHVVLCLVKWWFVALFEQNLISWFKKMSILSLCYWESDVYWRQNRKHFADLAPTKWRKTADMKKLRHCHPMYKLTVFTAHSLTIMHCINSLSYLLTWMPCVELRRSAAAGLNEPQEINKTVELLTPVFRPLRCLTPHQQLRPWNSSDSSSGLPFRNVLLIYK